MHSLLITRELINIIQDFIFWIKYFCLCHNSVLPGHQSIMIKEGLPPQQILILVLFENLMIPTMFLTSLTSMLYLDSDKKSYCRPKP